MKLFSCVFGEGITNDIVAIILFNTVHEFCMEGGDFTATTPLILGGSFIFLAICSLFVGLFYGLFSALLLKKCRMLSHNPAVESVFVFSFAYLSYATSERFHFSGLIALMTTGVMMSQYSWYNLSPQAKTGTTLAFSFIGLAFEAFVFAYLGLACFSYHTYNWSTELIFVLGAATITARFMTTVCLVKICE
jgi:NhaP-type Na+/H+ or K+/H+ antiporter